MTAFLYFCLGVSGLVVLIEIVWRLASRRHSLPCPTWLGWLVELENPFIKNYRAAEIVRHLELQPGMKVLDLGCGPGRLTIPVAREIGPLGEVTAADIQPGMLRRVEAKARAAKMGNIRFLQAGAGEGKLGSNLYDRALLVTVLGEIRDREGALKEIFTALKPGGILSITEAFVDPHFQNHSRVRRLGGKAGFREKNLFGNRLAYTMTLEKPVID
jgi:SAM-dependent methyltransferase